jgi:hypothetical protein
VNIIQAKPNLPKDISPESYSSLRNSTPYLKQEKGKSISKVALEKNLSKRNGHFEIENMAS